VILSISKRISRNAAQVAARPDPGQWFVAILNGSSARSLNVPLSFLGAAQYKAMLIRDSVRDAAAVEIENSTLCGGESLRVELRAGGGFVGRFWR